MKNLFDKLVPQNKKKDDKKDKHYQKY